MIKGQHIEDLAQQGLHDITAMTKPQIDKLLRTGTLQMDLFEQEVAEVLTDEGIRYVLRRNPVRAQDMRDTRHAKLATLQAQVAKQNHYLTDHPRANVHSRGTVCAPYCLGGDSRGWLPRICSSNRFRASAISWRPCSTSSCNLVSSVCLSAR